MNISSIKMNKLTIDIVTYEKNERETDSMINSEIMLRVETGSVQCLI